MGTYAVTHIKYKNQILPFSDSYDGYISDGMGENNLRCIRNMGTNFLRTLFDQFTAYNKIDIDKTAELSDDELYDEEKDGSEEISKLKIHNFIENLKSNDNDVTKDKTFHQWLQGLDGFTSTSMNGAPIILGLNQAVHYGRDYQECDYLIDLDNETFSTVWAPFTISFSDIRKMSHSQISMLCHNPFENMTEAQILNLTKEYNISKEVLTCSLQNLIDLAHANFDYTKSNESHIIVKENAKKLQPRLDEFIHFIFNAFKEKSTEIEETSFNEPVAVVSTHHNLEQEEVLSSMLNREQINQNQFDKASEFLKDLNKLNVSNISYSVSTFNFNRKNILVDINKIIALKNFLQENFQPHYPELDKELKIFLDEGIIELISFNNNFNNYSFSRIMEHLFDKHPSAIFSSSLNGNSHLNPDSEEGRFYAFYEDSMFLNTQDFLNEKFPNKEQLMTSENKINPLFAISYIKDITLSENIKYLDLNFKNSQPYIAIFALHSFNQDLYDLTINSFLDNFKPEEKNFDMVKNNLLENILSFKQFGDYLINLPFSTKESVKKIQDFNKFVYNHSSTQKFMENLTEIEKNIFQSLIK